MYCLTTSTGQMCQLQCSNHTISSHQLDPCAESADISFLCVSRNETPLFPVPNWPLGGAVVLAGKTAGKH